MDTIKWGIISTAKIGVEKVIPSMQKASNCLVAAISSRSSAKAQQAAKKLDIPRYHSSYEDLLVDPEIDAVYNPLPNHLHVPYTIKAMEAGKHVLCEKPIALDAGEAKKLLDATKEYPELKVMEAFMYRFHPQWIRTKSMIENGEIGELQTIHSFVSYHKDDPDNIRNKAEFGGGGLMDIGCYCISIPRFLFNKEPENVIGQWKIDPQFETDYLASGILDFGSETATFTCATQSSSHQEVNIVGTKGHIVVDIPLNAPMDQQTKIWHFRDEEREEIIIEPANQYTLQAREFANSVIEDTAPPIPLDDTVENMKVIDAFRESAGKI